MAVDPLSVWIILAMALRLQNRPLKRNLNRFAGPQTRFFVMDYQRYFCRTPAGADWLLFL
jgi:hypothetical protein